MTHFHVVPVGQTGLPEELPAPVDGAVQSHAPHRLQRLCAAQRLDLKVDDPFRRREPGTRSNDREEDKCNGAGHGGDPFLPSSNCLQSLSGAVRNYPEEIILKATRLARIERASAGGASVQEEVHVGVAGAPILDVEG